MIEIALAHEKTGVFQKDIAENQGISNKYLDHIILALKVAGLIINVRGKKSGYTLTRNPSEITMYDIHNAFEPGICVIDCMDCNMICERESICAARGFWLDLNNKVVDHFSHVTLKDLVENHLRLMEQEIEADHK
jgi:Rrf2 family protein